MTENKIMTPAERKRRERKKKKEMGLLPGEVWALSDDWKVIREIEKKSKEEAKKNSKK